MAVLPDPAPDCGSCAARDERIAAQDELIGELRGALGEQADQIAALREQVARLERALNRNSGNSSMPPSSDDLPGKEQPRPKPGRGSGKRKPGKQPLRHEAQCYIPRSARRDWRYVSGSDG